MLWQMFADPQPTNVSITLQPPGHVLDLDQYIDPEKSLV